MTLKSMVPFISFVSSGGGSSGRRRGAVGSLLWSLRGWVQPFGVFEGVRGSIDLGAWSFITWLRVD